MSDAKVSTRVGRNVHPAPRVSVVIPAYDVARFIAETVDSVLAQTVDDYEIILVNDGSPDTAQLEENLARQLENVVYLKQDNGGTARARNTAIAHARGDVIAFLDGDDVWLPEYLREQIWCLNAGHLDMVYTNALLFGAVPSAHETFMDTSPSKGPADFEGIVSGRCNVITSGTVVRKQSILDAGLFDTELPRIGMEDFDLWLRLAKAGARIGYQRRVLLKYRIRPDSLSGTSMQHAHRDVVGLKIVRKKMKLTPREEEVWRETLNRAEAELFLETGKAHLLREEFGEARKNVRAANAYYRRPKLKLIDWALSVSPNIVVRLFKAMNPE